MIRCEIDGVVVFVSPERSLEINVFLAQRVMGFETNRYPNCSWPNSDKDFIPTRRETDAIKAAKRLCLPFLVHGIRAAWSLHGADMAGRMDWAEITIDEHRRPKHTVCKADARPALALALACSEIVRQFDDNEGFPKYEPCE